MTKKAKEKGRLSFYIGLEKPVGEKIVGRRFYFPVFLPNPEKAIGWYIFTIFHLFLAICEWRFDLDLEWEDAGFEEEYK